MLSDDDLIEKHFVRASAVACLMVLQSQYCKMRITYVIASLSFLFLMFPVFIVAQRVNPQLLVHTLSTSAHFAI